MATEAHRKEEEEARQTALNALKEEEEAKAALAEAERAAAEAEEAKAKGDAEEAARLQAEADRAAAKVPSPRTVESCLDVSSVTMAVGYAGATGGRRGCRARRERGG